MEERELNEGVRTFAKYLSKSAGRVEGITCRDLTFDGVVLTNKQDLTKTTKVLHVSLDTEIKTGDVLFLKNSRWIIYQKVDRPLDSYLTFFIVKCNYLLKWIDRNGMQRESYVYLVGSKDAIIKDNFRTWNNLITPQANRFLEIIVPENDFEKGTRFLVDKEGWTVVDYDRISVSGIRYVTAQEDKVNLLLDDIDNSLANSKNEAEFTIEIPGVGLEYSSSDTILPIFGAYKNGILSNNISYSTSGILRYIDGDFSALRNGQGYVSINLLENNIIKKTAVQSILITDTPQENPRLLKGSYQIKLDREETYTLLGYSGTLIESNIELSDDKVKILSISGNSFTLLGNNKNKTGKTTLSVSVGDHTYTKEITVIPLW